MREHKKTKRKGKVVTVQQTSKVLKFQYLIAVIIAIVSGYGLFYCTDLEAHPIIFLTMIGSLIWAVMMRMLMWWYHG